MNQPAVRFQKLEVDRVLGIRRGDRFTLNELSEEFNLICGPNGSGKSTTAKVIQELLWPGRTGLVRPSAGGVFRLADEEWSVLLDAGHPEFFCDGRNGNLPSVGPPENRYRYRLALDELLGEDNAEFAKAIADASQGGFDLESAARKAGFREKPPSRTSERKKVEEARSLVDKARSRQRDIEGEAAKLDGLRTDRDRSITAQKELEALQEVLLYRKAAGNLERLESELAQFPRRLELLKGEELEELDRSDEVIARLENDRIEQEKRITKAIDELKAAGLDQAVADPKIVTGLRALERQIGTRESDLRQHESRLSEAEAAAEKVLQRLGSHFDRDQLVAIETVEIEPATGFARESVRLRAEERAAREMQRWLAPESGADNAAPSSDELKEGIRLLGRWLSSGVGTEPAGRTDGFLIAASVLVAALGLVLAFMVHPAWGIMALVAIALVLMRGRRERQGHRSEIADPRRIHRDDYSRMDLPQPEAWEEAEVNRLLSRLVRLTGETSLEEERKRRREDVAAQLDELGGRLREMEMHRDEIQHRLGLRAEIGEEWLPLLIDNVGEWQKHHTTAVSLRSAVAKLKDKREALLQDAAELLVPFGVASVDSSERLAGVIDELANRQERFRNASREIKEAKSQLDRALRDLEDVASQKQKVLDLLKLADGDRHTLQEWLRLRPRFLELRDQATEARAVVQERRRSLETRGDLLEMDSVAIKQRIETQNEMASMRDQLSERIAAINHAIKAAKEGHELSDALEEQQAALAELEQARDENRHMVVGSILKDWVRGVSIERSRPEVFRRANELLARFTRGSLQIELEDRENPPKFLAREGKLPARPLDELSTGERIQTLIAVRIAFIEQDEPVALPLLLDETLGASDDSRAAVIMDSVIEIARGGRQVFYFTAQEDEVGKWKARLESSGVSFKLINLAQVRQLESATAGSLDIAPVPSTSAPSPRGLSYTEYGRLLAPPPIDPFAESPDGIHLWHLLNDTLVLFELLSKDINTLGQLRTLVDHGGAGLIEGRFESALAAAKAVDAACRAWRIGRARAIGRSDLEESGAVSDVFINQVAELARSLKGNAGALIRALEEPGRVSRWRGDKTEALRAFFDQSGFLPDTEPLPVADVRLRAMAEVAAELKEGIISQDLVDRIVVSLPRD